MKNKKAAAILLTAAVGMGALALPAAVPKEAGVFTAVTAYAAAPSASKLASAVKKAYGDNYWPDYKLDKDEIKSKYGVDASLYASAYAQVPMISAHVDQLVIFKAKNSSSKKKILSAVKKYQKDLKEDTMQYPMNLLKIQGSKVYTNGKYVCFFMLGGDISKNIEENGSEAEIIKAYQKLNQKAVNAVKNALK